MKLGSNIIDVQKKNRCIVLQTLMEYQEISRVDLARITELNKATITNIISEFMSIGIVKDIGSIQASNGRRVAGISLCMNDVVSVVLCIRRDFVWTAVCDLHGAIENAVKTPYRDDTDIHIILEQFKKEIQKQIEYCEQNRFKVLGISVATLGWLYHEDDSYYVKADDFEVLGKVDVKKEMKMIFPNMEIWIDHDANMSALAEWQYYGRYEEHMPGSLLSIVGGIGFGGGIVIRGEVFSGFNGIAGEVGHMGINCLTRRHGRNSDFSGLLEEYASPLSLCDSVRENVVDYPNSVLNDDSGLEAIYKAYEEDDELGVWAVNRMARYLAYGLTGLVFVLNPEVIVLGDQILRSEKFSRQLYKYMKQYLPAELYKGLNIRFSNYDKSSILIGSGFAMVKHYLRTYKMFDFIEENFKEERSGATNIANEGIS